jgi:hypothetical protein
VLENKKETEVLTCKLLIPRKKEKKEVYVADVRKLCDVQCELKYVNSFF